VRQKKILLALRFTKARAVANGYYQVGEAKNQSVKLLIILISLFISKDWILEGLLLLRRNNVRIFTETYSTISHFFMKLTRARAGKCLSNGAHTLSLFVTACFKHEHLTGLVLFSPLVRSPRISPWACWLPSARNTPPYSNAVFVANFLVSGRVYTKMKRERHGQAKILTVRFVWPKIRLKTLMGRSV